MEFFCCRFLIQKFISAIMETRKPRLFLGIIRTLDTRSMMSTSRWSRCFCFIDYFLRSKKSKKHVY